MTRAPWAMPRSDSFDPEQVRFGEAPLRQRLLLLGGVAALLVAGRADPVDAPLAVRPGHVACQDAVHEAEVGRTAGGAVAGGGPGAVRRRSRGCWPVRSALRAERPYRAREPTRDLVAALIARIAGVPARPLP